MLPLAKRRRAVRPAPTPRDRERRVLAGTVVGGLLAVLGSVLAAVLATGGLGY
jgi:hypothetical protein